MPLSVASGDLLEFKLKGFFDGAAEVNNIFHYHVTDATAATLDQYAAGLWHLLAGGILAGTNKAVEYTEIEARILDTDGNLVNGETYIIPAGDGVGTEAGDALPPFVTFTFKYLRPNASFRHGFKRFAGVGEASQVDGVLNAGLVTTYAAIAAGFAADCPAYTIDTDGSPLAPVASSAMSPVVLQRVINGDPISPVNQAFITDVIFDKVGSQNTRKYGRGS